MVLTMHLYLLLKVQQTGAVFSQEGWGFEWAVRANPLSLTITVAFRHGNSALLSPHVSKCQNKMQNVWAFVVY
jgi:hypothetical protein